MRISGRSVPACHLQEEILLVILCCRHRLGVGYEFVESIESPDSTSDVGPRAAMLRTKAPRQKFGLAQTVFGGDLVRTIQGLLRGYMLASSMLQVSHQHPPIRA